MKGMNRFVPLLFLCGLSKPMAAVAQVEDSLRVHRLQTVEVKAQRTATTLTSSSPLQELNRGDMSRLGVTDIADALNRLPGIILRDYGGAGGLKTVSVRGFGARHTGVSYDGVLLSECQSGEIDVARYTVDMLQQVRLTIGDNDDIFLPARQAASAALLSIQTPLPSFTHRKAQVEVGINVGSFGHVSPMLRYAQSPNDRMAFASSLKCIFAENDYPFLLRNGQIVTHERRTNSRMRSAQGDCALYWRPNARNKVDAKVYYYDNNRQLPGIVRYYTNVCGEQLHDRNFFAQATWSGRLPDERFSVKVTGKFNWAMSDYRDTLQPDRKDDATYWQRESYVSATCLFVPNSHWAFNYACDYSFNNLNSTLTTDSRPFRHTLLQAVTARFTYQRLVALARLLATLQRNGAQQGAAAPNLHRLSPSLSLSYRLLPHKAWFLRTSYKGIFRAPTFNELYFYHLGSTNLQPENSKQWNIGTTWQGSLSRNLTVLLTADAYLNQVSQKIVSVPYNMFVWQTINVGKVEIKGCDLSVKGEWQPSQGHAVVCSAGYSYQRVSNHTDPQSAHYGKQLAYAPLHTASVAVGWTNPLLHVALHGTGSSGRWATNNHYEGSRMAGYVDVGLSLSRTFQLQQRQLALQLDIKNLTGKQYEVVANYPMPRTAWMLSLLIR